MSVQVPVCVRVCVCERWRESKRENLRGAETLYVRWEMSGKMGPTRQW